MRSDGDVQDVVDPEQLAGRAYEILLAVPLDVAGANIGIVLGDGLDEVMQGDIEGCEPLRIGYDMERGIEPAGRTSTLSEYSNSPRRRPAPF